MSLVAEEERMWLKCETALSWVLWQRRRWLLGEHVKGEPGIRKSHGLFNCFLVKDCVARFDWVRRSLVIVNTGYTEPIDSDWCNRLTAVDLKQSHIYSSSIWPQETTDVDVRRDTRKQTADRLRESQCTNLHFSLTTMEMWCEINFKLSIAYIPPNLSLKLKVTRLLTPPNSTKLLYTHKYTQACPCMPTNKV